MKYITSDKIIHHTDELNNWKEGKLVHPITVEVHPSNKCNNACHYCSMHKVKNGQEMSGRELGEVVDFCNTLDVKGLIFTGGGEPLMNENTIDAIAEASKNKIDVGLITNGVLLHPPLNAFLSSLCSWIRISLDAHTPELYKKIRGTDDFYKVTKNIIELLDMKKRRGDKCTIGLQMVVDENNYRHIEKFVQFCKKEFPNIDYIQVRPMEIKLTDKPYNGLEQKIIVDQLVRLNDVEKVMISDKWWVVFGKERQFGFSACHCADMIGAIDAYGDFYLCCHMIKNPAYKFCNVFDCSYEDFLDGRETSLSKLKAKGLNPKLCPVGCRGSNINRMLEGIKRGVKHKNFL